MKITEQAIRAAMNLSANVAVTLGTLDEPAQTRIAIVARSVYIVRQTAHTVEMLLQFAAHSPGVLGYPSCVTFDLVDTVAFEKSAKLAEAINVFGAELIMNGEAENGSLIFALLDLPVEQQATVYDALNAGLSKAEFLTSMAKGLNAARSPLAEPADVKPASKRVRLGDPAAAHLYNVGVNIGGGTSYIEVDAQNRAQAAKIAREAGYEVGDVNMIG